MAQKITSIHAQCLHCGEICEENSGTTESPFCCNGCKFVYELLKENNFQNYYCLNEKPGNTVTKIAATRFASLEEPAQEKNYIIFKEENKVIARFFLPQIHCSSCLWLLENLSKLESGIVGSQVNFIDKKLSVTFLPAKITLRKIAELLATLGYPPQLFQEDENTASEKSQTRELIKIGVAFFCFANIMLFSFPEYLGLNKTNNPEFLIFFRWANLVLSIPVLVYCARDFFVNAWNGLRQFYVNIDAPIVLAILVCFFRSVSEILSQHSSGYLDSMAGIVLLMLTGRYLQHKTFKSLRFDRTTRSFFPVGVVLLKDNVPVFTYVEALKTGDSILLSQEEVIPLDCLITKGSIEVNHSFITGESGLVTVSVGDYVYAGGKVVAGAGEAIVAKTFSQNNFLNLWDKNETTSGANKATAFEDSLGRYFSLCLLIIASSAFIFWQFRDPSLSWKVVTSVLLIACPCTLLLASSFLHGFLLNRFAAKGFFLKNYKVLENMTKVSRVIFDKTGTLTDAGPGKISFSSSNVPTEEEEVFLSLLALSRHPLSRAMVAQKKFQRILLEDYKEVKGKGLEAWYLDKHYKAGNAIFVLGEKGTHNNNSVIYISVDNHLQGYYSITNMLRPGIEMMIQNLEHYQPCLLSGDQDYARDTFAAVFPPGSNLYFQKSPEEKLRLVAQMQTEGHSVMMVGDGLNDAGALAAANVGIAVADHSFSFTPACKAIIQSASLSSLDQFIKASLRAKKLVVIMLLFSLIYNITGLYFALTAQLNPLVAAILMPSSSLSVILLAWFGARKIDAGIPAPKLKHD